MTEAEALELQRLGLLLALDARTDPGEDPATIGDAVRHSAARTTRFLDRTTLQPLPDTKAHLLAAIRARGLSSASGASVPMVTLPLVSNYPPRPAYEAKPTVPPRPQAYTDFVRAREFKQDLRPGMPWRSALHEETYFAASLKPTSQESSPRNIVRALRGVAATIPPWDDTARTYLLTCLDKLATGGPMWTIDAKADLGLGLPAVQEPTGAMSVSVWDRAHAVPIPGDILVNETHDHTAYVIMVAYLHESGRVQFAEIARITRGLGWTGFWALPGVPKPPATERHVVGASSWTAAAVSGGSRKPSILPKLLQAAFIGRGIPMPETGRILLGVWIQGTGGVEITVAPGCQTQAWYLRPGAQPPIWGPEVGFAPDMYTVAGAPTQPVRQAQPVPQAGAPVSTGGGTSAQAPNRAAAVAAKHGITLLSGQAGTLVGEVGVPFILRDPRHGNIRAVRRRLWNLFAADRDDPSFRKAWDAMELVTVEQAATMADRVSEDRLLTAAKESMYGVLESDPGKRMAHHTHPRASDRREVHRAIAQLDTAMSDAATGPDAVEPAPDPEPDLEPIRPGDVFTDSHGDWKVEEPAPGIPGMWHIWLTTRGKGHQIVASETTLRKHYTKKTATVVTTATTATGAGPAVDVVAAQAGVAGGPIEAPTAPQLVPGGLPDTERRELIRQYNAARYTASRGKSWQERVAAKTLAKQLRRKLSVGMASVTSDVPVELLRWLRDRSVSKGGSFDSAAMLVATTGEAPILPGWSITPRVELAPVASGYNGQSLLEDQVRAWAHADGLERLSVRSNYRVEAEIHISATTEAAMQAFLANRILVGGLPRTDVLSVPFAPITRQETDRDGKPIQTYAIHLAAKPPKNAKRDEAPNPKYPPVSLPVVTYDVRAPSGNMVSLGAIPARCEESDLAGMLDDPTEWVGLAATAPTWKRIYDLGLATAAQAAFESLGGELRLQQARPPSLDVWHEALCPVCFKYQAETPKSGTMYQHGYRRPGSGYNEAPCFGSGHPPWQKSNAGSEAYYQFIAESLPGWRRAVESWQVYQGPITAQRPKLDDKGQTIPEKNQYLLLMGQLVEMETYEIRYGDRAWLPAWKEVLANLQARLESGIETCRIFAKLVRTWDAQHQGYPTDSTPEAADVARVDRSLGGVATQGMSSAAPEVDARQQAVLDLRASLVDLFTQSGDIGDPEIQRYLDSFDLRTKRDAASEPETEQLYGAEERARGMLAARAAQPMQATTHPAYGLYRTVVQKINRLLKVATALETGQPVDAIPQVQDAPPPPRIPSDLLSEVQQSLTGGAWTKIADEHGCGVPGGALVMPDDLGRMIAYRDGDGYVRQGVVQGVDTDLIALRWYGRSTTAWTHDVRASWKPAERITGTGRMAHLGIVPGLSMDIGHGWRWYLQDFDMGVQLDDPDGFWGCLTQDDPKGYVVQPITPGAGNGDTADEGSPHAIMADATKALLELFGQFADARVDWFREQSRAIQATRDMGLRQRTCQAFDTLQKHGLPGPWSGEIRKLCADTTAALDAKPGPDSQTDARRFVKDHVVTVVVGDKPVDKPPVKRKALPPPSTMTAGALNKELDTLEAQRSEVTQQLIAAGRGRERASDYQNKTDPLSVRARELDERTGAVVVEMEIRYGSGQRLPGGRLPTRGYPARQTVEEAEADAAWQAKQDAEREQRVAAKPTDLMVGGFQVSQAATAPAVDVVDGPKIIIKPKEVGNFPASVLFEQLVETAGQPPLDRLKAMNQRMFRGAEALVVRDLVQAWELGRVSTIIQVALAKASDYAWSAWIHALAVASTKKKEPNIRELLAEHGGPTSSNAQHGTASRVGRSVESITVDTTYRRGIYAAHSDHAETLDLYIITHVPTGLAIQRNLSRAQAKHMIDYLNDQVPDAGRDATFGNGEFEGLRVLGDAVRTWNAEHGKAQTKPRAKSKPRKPKQAVQADDDAEPDPEPEAAPEADPSYRPWEHPILRAERPGIVADILASPETMLPERAEIVAVLG